MQRENISRMQEIPWEKKKRFEDTYQEQNTLSLRQPKLCYNGKDLEFHNHWELHKTIKSLQLLSPR